jgi:hypothetical protein
MIEGSCPELQYSAAAMLVWTARQTLFPSAVSRPPSDRVRLINRSAGVIASFASAQLQAHSQLLRDGWV